VTLDPPGTPVTPDLPVRAELAHFTNDDRRLDAGELARRGVLPRFLCNQVDLTLPSDQVAQRRVAELLARHLGNLAYSARQWVLSHQLTDIGYKEACEVAAFGELLGLTDDDQFEQLLVQLKGRRARYVEQYVKASARPGKKEPRQVRAAAWLHDVTSTGFSSKFASKNEQELIATFHQRLIDYIQQNRQTLASELMDNGANSDAEIETSPPPANPQQPTLRPTYEHRPEVEQKFWSLVDAGAKVIVLHGLPGMGKTWLAEQLTLDQATGRPAPIIDASKSKPETLSIALTRALSAVDLDPPPSSDAVAQLARLASSEQAPPFIVLDNLGSANKLKTLLPRHVKSVIVVTSRRAEDPPTTYEHIYVDRMGRTEAVKMAKTQLSGVSEEDIDYLASTFNDYPLVIGHVCAHFPNQQAPLRRLCDELKRDARRLAERVETEDKSLLLAILRRTVRLVKRRDKATFELLVFMCFIDERMYRPILWRYFEAFMPDEASNNMLFAYAISNLKTFALIQCEPGPLGYCTMHPFTQEVLKLEFDSRQVEVLARFMPIVEEHMYGILGQSGTVSELTAEYFLYFANMIGRRFRQIHPEWNSWSDEQRKQFIVAMLEGFDWSLIERRQ
jgi:hypothetical protein